MLLRPKLAEVLRAITPLVGTVCVLQVTVVHAPIGQFLQFLAGSALAALGLVLLFAGIDHGVLPMGRFIGAELPRKGSPWLILGVAAALGFVTTVAEPDVLILAAQAEAASEAELRRTWLVYLIAAGVGLFTAGALLRIVLGVGMRTLVAVAFALMIGLSLVAPAEFVPIAFDAGSVTTGVLTAPVLLALSLGLSAVLAGRAGALDGFGLLGLASAGPVVVVLLLGWLR
jgi:hypothetical protein